MRNKRPGPCVYCGQWVPKGKGHPELLGRNRWGVRHTNCVGKGNPQTATTNYALRPALITETDNG